MLQTIIQKFKYGVFSFSQQQALLDDIGALIEDGVPLNQAVDMLSRLTTGLTREVVNAIFLKIAEGRLMAEGLIGWYPPHIVEIIRAGEEGGTFAKTLIMATRSLAQKNKVLSTLLHSLSYPLIIITLGFIVTVFINHSVFKEFSAVKPIVNWPSNAQFVVLLGDIIEHFWFWILLIVGLILVSISQLLRNYTGNIRPWIDVIPGLALYRKLKAARLMETLGLLVTNGVVFKKALKIMQYNANPYLAWHLLMMEFKLDEGQENRVEVLDTGLIDKADLLRMRIIAQGCGFEQALLRQGQRASQRALQRIKVLSKTLSIVLLVLSALLTVFLITSVYSVGSMLGS